MGACTKVFVKFADDVRPFWDAKQTILYVDSEAVDSCLSSNVSSLSSSTSETSGATETAAEASKSSTDADQYIQLRAPSAAIRYALKRGDRYTRGYFTVSLYFVKYCTLYILDYDR